MEDKKPSDNWMYISPSQLEGSHNHNHNRNKREESIQTWLCEVNDIRSWVDGIRIGINVESD